MNKKKILIGISGILVIIIILITTLSLILNKDFDNEVFMTNVDEEKTSQVGGFLTLMLETEAGSGTYEKSTSSSWPGSDYIFNENLSACENDGKLSWNDEKKAVILNSFGSDACYVYFDLYIRPIINNVTVNEITANSISISVESVGGTSNISGGSFVISTTDGALIYTDSTLSGTYDEIVYNNLSAGTDYIIRIYYTDELGYESDIYELNITTNEPPTSLAEVCSNGDNLVNCITDFYNKSGSNITNIYYHTSNLANGASDNSYRYSGASDEVNNYVCFGSDAASCPSNNLYRIIGVFGNEVKLIKWDYANSDLIGTSGAYTSSTYSASSYSNYDGAHSTVNRYYWNPSGTNTWSSSTLNTTNLNSTYLNSLGSTWSNLIATHSWKVEGAAWDNVYNGTPRTAYNYEVGSNSSSTTYNSKIGLMYASDYGFAASNSYWASTLGSYNNSSITSNNWMYMGMSEWTISRSSDDSIIAFRVDSIGVVAGTDVSYGSTAAVRPVFYLTSATTYVSGSGTSSDPIRIN